jgi:hypothetical protein
LGFIIINIICSSFGLRVYLLRGDQVGS